MTKSKQFRLGVRGGRVARVARVAGAALLLVALGAQASEFYDLKLIGQTEIGDYGGWAPIGNNTISINNQGLVAWRAIRFNDLHSGIFVGDGTTTQVVEASALHYSSPTVLDNGNVSFLRHSGQTEKVTWSSGILNTNYLCANGLLCDGRGFAENGALASRLHNSNVGSALVRVNSQGATDDLIAYSGYTGIGALSISRNGAHVAMAANDRDSRTGVLTLGGFRHFSGQPDRAAANAVINDHGDVAFAIPGFIGVLRGNTGAIRKVASSSEGDFTILGDDHQLAFNNFGVVTFGGHRGPGYDPQIWIGDGTGRASIPVTVGSGERIGTDGTVFSNLQQLAMSPQSINDKGQIAFYAWTYRDGQGYRAVLRADPKAGVTPGNALLPDNPVNTGEGWQFTTRGFGQRARTYIDPEVAIGYDYALGEGAPNFASVYIPTALPGGDDTFELIFAGQSHVLHAGDEFDFTAFVAGGVASFRLAGLDASEGIDPNAHAPFVTGLTFMSDRDEAFTVHMRPLVAVPEPGTYALMALGLAGIGLLRRRQQRGA